MPFFYPLSPHERKHGPTGYDDYKSYKPWLRDEFSFRCVYCLVRERWYPDGQDSFCVEHILPKATPGYEHLECWYGNLVYACRRCNSAKGQIVLPIDPCQQAFGHHLEVQPDGTLKWLTEAGMKLVRELRLNDPEVVNTRSKYIELLALWRNNPDDAELVAWIRRDFGYPDDLPRLAGRLRKKGQSNTRPKGLKHSFIRMKELDKLPDYYGIDN